jgi:hypothetical protein
MVFRPKWRVGPAKEGAVMKGRMVMLAVGVLAIGLAWLPMAPTGWRGGGLSRFGWARAGTGVTETAPDPAVNTPPGAPDPRAERVRKRLSHARALFKGLQRDQAVDIYRQLLADPDLTAQERAKTNFLLAQTYEFMKDKGEDARRTYLEALIKRYEKDAAVTVPARKALDQLKAQPKSPEETDEGCKSNGDETLD